MRFGLSDSLLTEITEVFRKFHHIDKAAIFGSRAMGNYSQGSDIDLAVFGSDLSHSDLLQIRAALDELEILFGIDIIHFETTDNVDLKAHIKKVGQIIYDGDRIEYA